MRWQASHQIRWRHAMGSPEDAQYWNTYRAASDRLWARVSGRG